MTLAVEGIEVRYGATRALRDVSCEVAKGEVVALIGANGAGKSTLLRSIAGLHTPRKGTIRLFGEDISRKPAHQVARSGLCLVAEGRQLFTDLTVRENLLIGRYGSTRDDTKLRARFDFVFDMFPILSGFAERKAGTLSGGQQQMLAIGRALMGEPRILLLDEPSLGLAPMVVAQILQIVGELADDGMTVLLAEQNAGAALRTANRGIVLSNGAITHTAPAADLLADEDVSRHYLGADGEHRSSDAPVRELPQGLDRLMI